ncbi:hypothetical protein BK140_27420 [Paenibacillus macerans]|nr:hypothetical protein BK140_27420 [Paenibacillus macerans]
MLRAKIYKWLELYKWSKFYDQSKFNVWSELYDQSKLYEMQKCRRISSKLLETGGSNAKVQFKLSHSTIFYHIHSTQLHFCIPYVSGARKLRYEMHFCI